MPHERNQPWSRGNSAIDVTGNPILEFVRSEREIEVLARGEREDEEASPADLYRLEFTSLRLEQKGNVALQ